MIATITLNPSLDEYIMVDGLVVEETNRWSHRRRYAGGKGIDVSRAIHEMDGITIAHGFIGGPAGRGVEILLDEEGVLFRLTPIKNETRTNFIIVDTRNYQQTRIGDPGPRVSKKELDRFCKKLKGMRPKPSLVVASGSVPPGVPDNIYYDIIMGCRGDNIRTILDSSEQWMAEGINAKPYLIKPNVHETERLLGRELPNEEAVIEAALDLVEMGIEIVAISRGKEGIIAATKGRLIKAVPPPVKVRSAVGAGDCTVAGLALKLAYRGSLLEACRLAVAMGAACVLTPGTELCRRADVERLLPKVKVWEMPVNRKDKASFTANN
ncbi:1-phosphofructokinase [Chloroflexota bacterium]